MAWKKQNSEMPPMDSHASGVKRSNSSLRSLGIYMLVCGALCGLIAWDKYYSALKTGQELAARYSEIDFVSVGIPFDSIVCGAGCVMLSVAGAICIWKAVLGVPSTAVTKK